MIAFFLSFFLGLLKVHQSELDVGWIDYKNYVVSQEAVMRNSIIKITNDEEGQVIDNIHTT